MNRKKDGTLNNQEWVTVEVIIVRFEDWPVSVQVLDRVDKNKKMALPPYSNKPYSIYAMRDPRTGKISQIRFYDKDCKGYLDLEYHGTLFHPSPFYHKHIVDFEANQGHKGEHLPLTDDDKVYYKELIELLDT